ncbi:ATP-dependent RNA helicase DBP10 [Scheffersomyces coipomensis]|uniref:ATP-dependent RNA helicase DBP10 n=1 Tax=Scheffersomyces coipomensis TaxID=1788519 RepID=UPI00315D9D0F
MSDQEEDYDIAGALTLNGDESDIESGSDSESYSQDEEIQDIIESDDEVDKEEPKQKKQKVVNKASTPFPSLEMSDDEGDEKNNQNNDNDDLKDISSYFANNNPDVKKAKAGSFQSFGFSKFLMTNVIKKGYRQPTPIQRKTIPLIMEGRDVVGMARTGSGKTAAFTLPMIERLKNHSARVGVRAVILSPSRELALQTFKQVREFTKNTDLKSVVLIGGDSLEEQFSSVLSNPDIIVATPGRFLHLKVEMELDLKSVECIIFDEADRLFEMGFAEQLNELLASLPSSRQSLLFSATLPRSLVDFAKAGLTSPVLVRLDADSKISDNLQMAYFTTKRQEREANLLYIIQEVIKIPLGTKEQLKKLSDLNKKSNEEDEEEENRDKTKKRKFKKERLPPANQLPSEHSTIVFVPTKHHVEYIYQLLRDAGYLVSYIYGTLDQHARKNQLYQFRIGVTNILVVTDVAARGIDIPVLANVINFTFPASSKIFIHRVGRTARAGNKGWAYSIINEKELPYLLDLELFLGKKILLTSMYEEKAKITGISPPVSYTDRLVLGSVPRLSLETFQELFENLVKHNYDLQLVKDVTFKAEKLYYRTRQAASAESLKRSKEIFETDRWDGQHLLFGPDLEKEKQEFLNKLLNRNVKETVFEFSKRNNAKHASGEDEDNNLVDFMNKRRRQLAPIQRKAREKKELLQKERIAGLTHGLEDEVLQAEGETGYNVNEDELRSTFEDADDIIESKKKEKKSFRDPNFFISHYAPASLIQDQQLQLSNSFANDAAKATFDFNNDDTDNNKKNQQIMKWDRKKGKYINSTSDGKKYIIGESGQKIPATYKSGRFDDWKKKRNLQPAKVGSLEASNGNGTNNQRFQHKKVAAPKLPDKYRDDYFKQKKKVDKALESGVSVKGYNRAGQQQEIKTTEQIRKARQLKENKRAKNARPSKRRK